MKYLESTDESTDNCYIAFSVGDGTSDEDGRHNLFDIRTNDIAYVNSQPIMVSYQGPVTKLWRGTAADYANNRDNIVNEHTLYAIDDGLGFNKDGLVFKAEFEALERRVKYLESLLNDVVFKATETNSAQYGNNTVSYLWVGSKANYNAGSHKSNTLYVANA